MIKQPKKLTVKLLDGVVVNGKDGKKGEVLTLDFADAKLLIYNEQAEEIKKKEGDKK